MIYNPYRKIIKSNNSLHGRGLTLKTSELRAKHIVPRALSCMWPTHVWSRAFHVVLWTPRVIPKCRVRSNPQTPLLVPHFPTSWRKKKHSKLETKAIKWLSHMTWIWLIQDWSTISYNPLSTAKSILK